MGFNLGNYVLILSFGFEAVPYTGKASPLTSRLGRPRRGSSQYGYGKTTVQVAKELEDQYGIVETFFQLEEQKITDLLEEAYVEEISEVVMMQRLTKRTRGISTKETDKIEQSFRQSIDRRRFDGLIQGVPTTASLRGVSHLLPQPYSRKNSTRPSFKDTGLYQSSFRAWVTEEE